jgi:GNAT superfamily N-acetyltransferase
MAICLRNQQGYSTQMVRAEFRAQVKWVAPEAVGRRSSRESCSVNVTIRPAARADAPALRQVEIAAGQRFREVGLDTIADDKPPAAEVFEAYAAAGRAWVAVGPNAGAVGFVVVDVVDGAAHIEQVSVVPGHQGRGVGRALIDQVERWAGANGLSALTLTTFDHVPWNRPLYEHLGFVVLVDAEIGPGLRSVLAREAADGLDPATRVAMRKDRDGVDREP